MYKVLFVCTGNTCRSPMFEYVLKHYLSENGAQNICVDSAGTMRHTKPMASHAKEVLRAHGIEFDEDKISKHCDVQLLETSDVVFTMTLEQCEYLKTMCSFDCNILPLCDIIGYEVDDPYEKGLKAYENTYDSIEKALPIILNYIAKTGV